MRNGSAETAGRRALRLASQAMAAAGVTTAAGLLVADAIPAHAVTGICPDGSVFVARPGTPAPCSGAKEVESSEVLPLRPDYLPQPLTWQVYQELQNPSNPYNLIDQVREIRRMHEDGPGEAQTAAVDPNTGLPDVAATAPVGPLDLGLSDEELRSLYQLVDLSQEITPAAFERRSADGSGVFRVALARSLAFESRLANAWASRGGLGEGQVLVFTAVSKRPEPFHANLTFVQGHLTFQPVPENPRQLGILQGHLGDLAADEVVLGYVILPDDLHAHEPMDVYWNDRRIQVAFPQ